MFINHIAKEIVARIVYCAPPGVPVSPTFDCIHQRAANACSPIRNGYDGTRYVSQLEFAPPQLGLIRGFRLRLLLIGFESTDVSGAPCDLSGFKDVDGVVFIAFGGTPLAYTSQAYHQLSESLGRIGYDIAQLPFVLQLQDVPDPNTILQLMPLRGMPVVNASPVTGMGIFEGLKAITRLCLIALKAGATKTAPAPS